jgi:5,6,7,8-tetrahydromethanopterin hydro-lyase
VTEIDEVDRKSLVNVYREATTKVIKKAMGSQSSIGWLLKNQDKVEHYFHQMVLKGEL